MMSPKSHFTRDVLQTRMDAFKERKDTLDASLLVSVVLVTAKQLMHAVQCHHTHDPKSDWTELVKASERRVSGSSDETYE